MTESGLLIVDKPAGMTSHDVVSRARRLMGTRKIGHAGTLDPMATGVLVLGVERATRLLGHLMLTDKRYDATVRLGISTTTDDAEGEVVATTSTLGLTEESIRAAFATQVGNIEQVPTAVSAIKVDGKRAYQRVRDGEEVELKARPVTVHSLTVIECHPQGGVSKSSVVDVDISVHCSSGTYIRAIARDVGNLLGVGGHLSALRRTAVGPYDLSIAKLIEDATLVPIAAAAREAFACLDLDEGAAQDVRYGRKLAIDIDETTAVFAPDGEFLALYEPTDGGLARATAVFVG